METLVCNIIVDNARIIVVSPLIGRLKLSVSTGQLLGPSQVIGTAMRLNRHFVIKLPAEMAVATIAAITSADRVIAVEFGEHVMELQVVGKEADTRALDKQKNVTSTSVDAPMDGMFYLAASPKDPPYVKIGDVITPGQTIGLIEVMKCFYPLKYQGRERVMILDIVVTSASPVSSGMKLLIVSPLQ